MPTPSDEAGSRITAAIPRVIRPGSPTTQTVYQQVVELRTAGQDPVHVMDVAVHKCMDWVQGKYAKEIPSGACEETAFIDEMYGQRVQCNRLPDRWAAQLTQPDAPFRGREAVGGRTWVTDMGLVCREGKLLFGIRVTCASLPGVTDEIFLTRSKLVAELREVPGFAGDTPMRPEPWTVGSDLSIDQLHALLTSADRHMPVVVLTQPNRATLPIPNVLDFVLDPDHLAQKAFGYAHVVLLPWAEAFEWTDRVGKMWSVYGGAVRTYQPGLDMEREIPQSHPLTLFERILFWRDGDSGRIAEPAFTSFLVDWLQHTTVARRMDWGDIRFVSDVALEAKRLTQRQIEDAVRQSRSEAERLEHLREQVANRDEQVALLEEKLDAEKTQTLEYYEQWSQADTDLEYLRDENSRLRSTNHALRAQLQAKTGTPVDESVEIPETYESMDEWVAENLVGRLMLHPRVMRGIAEAQYERPDLVYRCLLLLANEYRSMRLGELGKTAYDEAREALHLRDDPSIDQTRANELGEEYYIRYPLGGNRREFLARHLRSHGNSRDPRRCLAVYFLWDANTSQVVVGWLPSHLRNRLS